MILAVCPADWLGVRQSITHGADAYSDLAGARAAIRMHGPDEVRLGGYGAEWRRVARFARSRGCKVVVTLHHTPAFHELEASGRTAMVDAIGDCKAGLIDRLETPHEGLARTLSQLGVPCTYRRNVTNVPRPATAAGASRSGVRIGIFGTAMPWKNMDAQMLAAALAIKHRTGGSIHVQHIADPSLMKVLGVEYQIHPRMEGPAFAAVLASMTVNMAVSFTETFGYLPVESFLLGVPCLFSPMTPAFFEVDRQSPLWRCRVERIDDPAFMAVKIGEVLEHLEEITTAGRAFCERHVADRPAGDGLERRPAGVATSSPMESPSGRRGVLARLRWPTAHLRKRESLGALLDTIRRIRAGGEVIAVTPLPDDYVWLGVNRATHALFPDRVVDLPLALARSREGHRDVEEVAGEMARLGFAQVILSGFPACSESLARDLRGRGTRVGCLFHGFLAECTEREGAEAFGNLLRLCREGVIAKLACNKKGLPQIIERITGIKVGKFIVPTSVGRACPSPRVSGTDGLHIGVLGQDLLRKNVHNQMAAALLVPRATVHVMGESGLDYWGCHDRIVRHPALMPHRDYVELLGRMDLNLHLSFSESWGQVTAESLAMGVPCLIADHSDIYDYDPVLRNRLVSHNLDDPERLADDIRLVLAERDVLGERGRAYVGILNERAEAHLKEFLAR